MTDQQKYDVVSRAMDLGRWDMLSYYIFFVMETHVPFDEDPEDPDEPLEMVLMEITNVIEDDDTVELRRGLASVFDDHMTQLITDVSDKQVTSFFKVIQSYIRGPFDLDGLPNDVVDKITMSLITPMDEQTFTTARNDFIRVRRLAMSSKKGSESVDRCRQTLNVIHAALRQRFATAMMVMSQGNGAEFISDSIMIFFQTHRKDYHGVTLRHVKRLMANIRGFLLFGDAIVSQNPAVQGTYNVMFNDPYCRWCIQRFYAKTRKRLIDHQRLMVQLHPRVTRQQPFDERANLERLLSTPERIA